MEIDKGVPDLLKIEAAIEILRGFQVNDKVRAHFDQVNNYKLKRLISEFSELAHEYFESVKG